MIHQCPLKSIRTDYYWKTICDGLISFPMRFPQTRKTSSLFILGTVFCEMGIGINVTVVHVSHRYSIRCIIVVYCSLGKKHKRGKSLPFRFDNSLPQTSPHCDVQQSNADGFLSLTIFQIKFAPLFVRIES